jgi:hypothetical protein
MFFFCVDKEEETFKMDIFFRKKRKKEKKHTPGDYKVLFSCVRVQKRVERLNPKRQKQKIFYLWKTKRKKKEKSKRNEESTKHTRTHIQNGMRTKQKKIFLVFF